MERRTFLACVPAIALAPLALMKQPATPTPSGDPADGPNTRKTYLLETGLLVPPAFIAPGMLLRMTEADGTHVADLVAKGVAYRYGPSDLGIDPRTWTFESRDLTPEEQERVAQVGEQLRWRDSRPGRGTT